MDDLTKKTENLNVKGGGGGPKHTFKSSFNANAAEFVPSWLPKEPEYEESYDDQYDQAYDDQNDQQYDQQYNQQYTQQYVPQQTYKAPAPKPAPKQQPKKKPAPKPAAPKPAPTPAPAPAPVVAEPVDEPEEDVVMSDIKENCNILFMGHVDAGKSTMGGHILLLTGMVDKRTMEKYEQEAKELGRESWYLSWALDLNQEERDKGKTTEYGRGAFVTENRRFTIIDAPGHRNYIPSMIEGASQADFGILVISARKGEFETGFEKDGQTREHVLLAKTAGVKKIVMVINKMDDPTVEWAQSRYDEILGKMMPFLKGIGYGKSDIEVLPISGFTGANMKDPLDPKVCSWWKGDPLLTLLEKMPLERKYSGPFLMPIADKTKDMGTIAMGKIESGRVKKGTSLLIMPNKKPTEVLAVYQDENEVPVAYNGDNVRLRLKGCDEDDVLPGFVLCQAKNPVHSVMQFEAQIQIVEYSSIMCAGYNAIMHAHTTREEVSIAELLHKIDKKTKRKSKKPPQFMKQGDVCVVRIEANRLVCLETYADYPQLGRFTIRDENRTVAVGKILKLIDNTQ